MDPLSILAVIGPLALYFIFLTLVHFRRRPTLLSGPTDALFLALALSGFFMVGIGPAVIPIRSLINNGNFAWILLFFLYILSIFLFVSTFSRKIVIYNLESGQVKRILAKRWEKTSDGQTEILASNGLVAWETTGKSPVTETPATETPATENSVGEKRTDGRVTPKYPEAERSFREATADISAGGSTVDTLMPGNVFFFPTFGITAYVTFFPLLKNATITVLGNSPKPKEWVRFQREIKETFSSVSTQRSRAAYIFAGLALVLGLAIFG